MSRWKKSTMKRTPKTILRHSTYNIWEERISLFVTANKHTWRKTTCGRDNREILYYLTFSGATSSRKNAPDWFIRFPVYKRRFHFRAGTGPTESQSARPWKGFVCLSYKPFNFRATFQFLSADARSFAVFNSTFPPSHAPCPPSSPHHRDTYRRCRIPLFSIRWWINSAYPKLSCAVYDCLYTMPVLDGSLDFR